MSINAVMQAAASRIGYYAPDDPEPGSESGRYLAKKMNQAWLRGPSWTVYWCMMFVSMCASMGGEEDAIGGLFYNTETFKWKNYNRRVALSDARYGDVALFDWGGDGVTDHVGFVEKNLGGGRLQTIEGNTSSGAAGSQSAGNGVWRRIRDSSEINCVIRPAYGEGAPAPTTARTSTDNQEMLDVDGISGPRTWARLQQVMGTHIDGVKDEPSPMIVAFQRWLTDNIAPGSIADLGCSGATWGELDLDGYDGSKTWRAFQYYAFCVVPWIVAKHHGSADWSFVDGIRGPVTTKVLQEMLNISYANKGALL